MKRVLTTIAALIAAQALMLGAWYAVERGRAPDAPRGPAPPVARQQTAPMDRPAPSLNLRRRDGSTLRLSEMQGRPLLLHFWATWCPPCRDELPALLAYAAEGDMPVVAVSLDRDWDAVRRFLGSNPPPAIVLADGRDVEQAFDVQSLPVTFATDPSGRLRLRLDGPQDWASATVRDAVAEVVRR